MVVQSPRFTSSPSKRALRGAVRISIISGAIKDVANTGKVVYGLVTYASSADDFEIHIVAPSKINPAFLSSEKVIIILFPP